MRIDVCKRQNGTCSTVTSKLGCGAEPALIAGALLVAAQCRNMEQLQRLYKALLCMHIELR